MTIRNDRDWRSAALSLASLLATGCGGGGARPNEVLVCPEGSSWDANGGVCVATRQATSTATAPPPDAIAPTEPAGDGTVTVTCEFANGWASLIPKALYPRDDSLLMQGLVGLGTDPGFWKTLPEYQKLAPYAAKPCTSAGVKLQGGSGEYMLLIGETDTFDERNDYRNNGAVRSLDLRTGTHSYRFRRSDLRHTWVCLSCPWVAFLGEGDAVGEHFVVLARRSSAGRRGTDRIAAKRVKVIDGRITLELVEVDPEDSFVDELVLEADGATLYPSAGGERSAVAKNDGAQLRLTKGTKVRLSYEVPGVRNGELDVVVRATGHYEPWSSLR